MIEDVIRREKRPRFAQTIDDPQQVGKAVESQYNARMLKTRDLLGDGPVRADTTAAPDPVYLPNHERRRPGRLSTRTIVVVPKNIRDLLHREIVKVLKLPDVKARLEGLGFDVLANSQEEFAAQIKEEIVKWGKVIRAVNIKVQ
jgi:hypothetical protein